MLVPVRVPVPVLVPVQEPSRSGHLRVVASVVLY